MNLFRCNSCGNLVFFENVRCVRCGHTLGFLSDVGTMSAMEDEGNGKWRALAPQAKNKNYRQCGNGRQYELCNWLLPVGSPDTFCPACRLNALIPNLSVPGNLDRWRKIELAKRRVLYTLQSLGMPSNGRRIAPEGPELRFRFVEALPGQAAPMTGHAKGVITLNIAEADEDERERRRIRFREPFRTLLGHMRHELAHYFWELLVKDSDLLEDCRKLFGDERANYPAALQQYYKSGPAAQWPLHFVSAYASAHPWEDWAETFAHYLHIIDSLQTAGDFGVSVNPPSAKSAFEKSHPLRLGKPGVDFDDLMSQWPALTCAINELNRGMGLPDLYPFVISPPVIRKLKFIHELFVRVQSRRETSPLRKLRNLLGRRNLMLQHWTEEKAA